MERICIKRMREKIETQIDWVTQLRYEDIPQEVIKRAKWVLLDSIGCILNGADGKKLPKEQNAKILKSTAMMVSTELYEGNRFAIGHPASHIVPILLAEAENKKLSYKECLRIFVCAYEIASRWGNTVRFTNEMLGHGTIMIAGASIVEGLLEGMSQSDFVNYMMTCESLPEVSTWQSVFEGCTLHDFYPGIAAVNAKNALYMVNENVKSSEQLVISVYDKISGTKVIEQNLIDGLGVNWYLLRNYFKVYTGCRFIHPFADVIEQLLKEGLNKDEIEEIKIYAYKKAARLVNQTVSNELEAKFSIPFSLATLIIKGRLYPIDIATAISDEEIKTLSTRIYLMEDDKYNAMLPDTRGGCVEVKKKGGDVIKREVFHAQGDFDNPKKFTEGELVSKFHNITDKHLEKVKRENLVKKILTADEKMEMREVFRDYYEAVE